jgi:DNA-binding transcriptional MocR family regulator
MTFLMSIDENSPQPIYRQILGEIRGRIENQVIRPGDRLPSTRRLADILGIHRSTVALAYQELWALGFVALRPGARPRVRRRSQIAGTENRVEKRLIRWSKSASPASGAVVQRYRRVYSEMSQEDRSSTISFESLDMDRRLLPLESYRSSLSRVTKKNGLPFLGYPDHAGYRPLREYVVRRLQNHGISVTTDEVLLTNGSQQGIDLVFRLIASPGKTVAIESPTYGHMLPLLHLSGLKPLEIPVREDGMDLTLLSRKIEKKQPSLLYTIPTFHNPTGVTTNQVHREHLYSICKRHRVPILEDGFDEEMKYFGRAVLPIKSMDTHNIVIYCGTFSKVLFPGVRIGWIVADRECIERLTAIRCFVDLSSSMILQASMYEFCRDGYYDRHISRMHRVFRKRMLTAIRTLREFISPEWAEWTEPNGGYLIWLKLRPAPAPPRDWEQLFASFGVKVAHGRRFFFSEPRDTYVRLSISTLDEDEIVEGVQRMSRALHEVHS